MESIDTLQNRRPSAWPSRPLRPLPVVLLAMLAMAIIGSLWTSSAAAADNTLTGSNPAADSTVATSPSSMVLTFAAPLGNDNVVVVACGGTAASVGTAQVGADSLTLTVPITAALPKGTCNVTWRVSQTNGSPGGNGTFAFKVAADTATTVATEPAGAASATTVASAAASQGNTAGTTGTGTSGKSEAIGDGPLAAFRFLSTTALAILFGSFVVISMAWPEGVEYVLTVRFLRITYYVALATTALFVVCLTSQATGVGFGTALSPAQWKHLTDYGPGVAALVRLAFVAACGWVVMRPERIIDPAHQLPAIAIPGIAVATLAFSRPLGDLAALGALAGIVHVLSMAVWVGGLVLLAHVVLAGPGEGDLVHAVRGFSRISSPAIVATVLSGAVQTYRLDRGALLSSGHGRVLLLKTAAVVAMVFIGLAARQFIQARLQRAEEMTAPLATRLHRALGFEAIIGIVVLVLSSWLLALTPGTSNAAGTTKPTKDLGNAQLIHNTEQGVDVNIAFTQVVGPNAVRVDVLKVPLKGFTGLVVEFTPPPETGVAAVTLNVPMTCACSAMLPRASGLPLDAPGTWTITVKINGVDIGSKNVPVVAQGQPVPSGTAATPSTVP